MSQPNPTEFEKLPKCPYCGYVEDEPWALFKLDDFVETRCNNCDKRISIDRSVCITYDTNPLEEDATNVEEAEAAEG